MRPMVPSVERELVTEDDRGQDRGEVGEQGGREDLLRLGRRLDGPVRPVEGQPELEVGGDAFEPGLLRSPGRLGGGRGRLVRHGFRYDTDGCDSGIGRGGFF